MKRTILLLLAVIMLLSLAACASRTATIDDLASLGAKSGEASDWQTQYDLGVRYLSEGRYEEAILAFNAAIEIDPKNPDAYIKLAEAYEQTGDDEAALRTLQAGAEASNDSNLGLLAERKQKELDKANEPAVTPAAEPEKPAEPEEPETPAEPDWPAQLAGIRYFGDVSNCHMSREAAEAYAAVLEQMPWTKEGASMEGPGPVTFTLKAALIDPGDGYPLLLTSYAAPTQYTPDWTGMGNDEAYQVWTYDGNQAAAYDFFADIQTQYAWNIEFGTFDGQLGIRVCDSYGEGAFWDGGYLYYTVSEYQIKLQHHLLQWRTGAHVDHSEHPYEQPVEYYMNEDWIVMDDLGDYIWFTRYELDGVDIRSSTENVDYLVDEFTRITDSFQPNSTLKCYSPDTIGGYLLGGWSDAAAMCAALRGQ